LGPVTSDYKDDEGVSAPPEITDQHSLVNDPRWWADPWWEGIEYQVEHRVSLAQIRAPIAALRNLFDEAWTRRAIEGGPPNAVLPVLYGGRGLWPFQNLIWLGNIVLSLSTVPSVDRPKRDLIGPKTRAALFEMEVGSWFSELGWAVEFLKPNVEGKRPDIAIASGDIVSAIECKRFNSEKWEEWAEALSMKLIQRNVSDGTTGVRSHDILFEPRLSDLVWGPESVRLGVLDELADRISAAVTQSLSANPPCSVRIPGVAEIRPRPDNPDSQRGIGGIEISPQGKTRRIITNGVLDAAQQLQGYTRGAVIVRADFTPPAELVDVVLCGLNRADPSLLKSAVVVVITGTLGAAPVIWRNPMYLGDSLSETLGKAFDQILTKPHHLFTSNRAEC
jgi:hypothetical protein